MYGYMKEFSDSTKPTNTAAVNMQWADYKHVMSAKREGTNHREEFVKWQRSRWSCMGKEIQCWASRSLPSTHRHTYRSKVKLALLSSPNWEELLPGQEGVRFWMTTEGLRLVKNLLSTQMTMNRKWHQKRYAGTTVEMWTMIWGFIFLRKWGRLQSRSVICIKY